MVFSEEKWNNGDEIRPYIAVSNAFSFRTAQTALQNAYGLFIRSLVGNAMTDKMQLVYDSVADISEIKESTKDKNIKLLYLTQRANAFLAYWYDYDEMQVIIADSGVKRQESETAKSPFKYQELSLKDGFKQKGFDALDQLILFLEENIDDYPEYRESENYTQSLDSIVRSAKEINEFYPINNSRLIYLRLKPNIRIVEDTIIAPRLGFDLYDDLKLKLKENTQDEIFSGLREKLIPVVALYAVRKLLMETGSVTDRGLFFSSLKGNEDSFASSNPVTDERIVYQANKAESDALSYWLLVERYLKSKFNIIPSNVNKIHRRNNDDKKTFWA